MNIYRVFWHNETRSFVPIFGNFRAMCAYSRIYSDPQVFCIALNIISVLLFFIFSTTDEETEAYVNNFHFTLKRRWNDKHNISVIVGNLSYGNFEIKLSESIFSTFTYNNNLLYVQVPLILLVTM